MGHVYTVGNKQIDVDDPTAVQALNDDELKDLLAQTLRSTPDAGDRGPTLPQRRPEKGTGFVLPGTPAPRA